MAELEDFPFPLGPRGRVHNEQYEQRLRENPLGEIRLPSGDVARLAVRHADAVKVMGDTRFTRNLSYPGAPQMYPGPNILADPDIMPNMDPPRHTRLRRLLSPALTPAKVAAWRPTVRAKAERLIDGLPGPEADFVNDVALPYAIGVIIDVMGVPGLDAERVLQWADSLMPSAARELTEQLVTLQEAAGYLAGLIATIRDDPGDGLLGTMIEARDEGDRLSDEELVRNTIGFVLAGHETTAATLSRGLLRLLDPRENYKELVARPELIPTAVEELLRVEVPGDGAPLRVATEDIELPSGTIRKGEAVVASFVGPNHDPAVFDSPMELRLDRTGPAHHVTFGWGAHFCLGAKLARMELEEILRTIVDRFPGLDLAEDPDEIPWTVSAIKRPTRLRLRLS
jgi:cytochrome P450